MKNHSIQTSFFDEVIKNNNIDNKQKSIYAKLIYMRFEEVLTSSLPQSTKIIESCLENYIREFIIYGSKCEDMKNITFEFVKFLCDTKKINSRLLDECLKFEINELKLYLSSKSMRSVRFDFNRNYQLSKNCMIMKVRNDILHQTYEKRKQYILIYKDISSHDVFHMELTKVLYIILNRLRNNESLEKTLKIVCLKEKLDYTKVKPIIIDTLKTFCKSGIVR